VQSLGKEFGSWQTPRGALRTWVLPGIFVTRLEGHMDLALTEHLIESGDTVISRYGSLTGFHDWQRAETYEARARLRLTSWGVEIRKHVVRVHILTGSKLVKMGVSVASIVLVNMLVGYDDRAQFENALREAVDARLPRR
jgi:hypothetical protein